MDKKVKLAFVGVGSIFEAHISAALKNPSIEVYAFCDINEEKLRAKGEKYGVSRLFTDYKEMFKLEEIDGVVVCTWNKEHAPVSIAAMKAGKHVFCEKPMAINATEAEEMLAVAKECNRQLVVGFVRRCGADCKAVRSFVEAGCLGNPYFAKAKYIRRNGYPGGWFGVKELSGGGPLIDLGVHVIDLIRYVTGNPKPISVYAMTSDKLGMLEGVAKNGGYSAQTVTTKQSDVEDFAAAMIRFDNGMVLSVETSFTLNGEDSAEVSIYGDKGGMLLEPQMKLYSVMNGYCVTTTPVPEAKFDWDNAFYTQMNNFVRAIKGEYSALSIAEDGVVLMKILSGAYESAKTGHEVILS
ncbi:MAG: Gfo/Idh/MocA family oxidoreductase [Clostridia bacterium]|nr:Gfo/Idh/MocA family oxidoreductase [Clostridia bacterium]